MKFVNKNIGYICLILACLGAVILGITTVGLPFANINIIQSDGSDYLGMAFSKAIRTDGILAVLNNPMLGESGSSWGEINSIDPINALLLFLFNKILPNYVVSFYVVFILGFVAATLSMFFCLNRILSEGSEIICMFVSVIYPLVPYHIYTGSADLSLSFYCMIPVAVYLAAYIINCAKSAGGVWNCVLAVLIGLCNIHYSLYCAVMILLAVIYRKAARIGNSAKGLYYVPVFTVLSCMLSRIPLLVYNLSHGLGMVSKLPVSLSQDNGLRLANLFIPPLTTGVPFARRLAVIYFNAFGYYLNEENSSSAMGMMGVVGIGILFIYMLFSIIRREYRHELMKYLVVLCLALYLLCTVGGVGSLFALYISPVFYNLSSVSVVFCTIGLLVSSIAIDQIRKKQSAKTAFIILMVISLVSAGEAVRIPRPSNAKQSIDRNEIYKAFFEDVENRLGDGAKVYCLPNVELPCNRKITATNRYAMLRGYLYSDNIHYSTAGVRGYDPGTLYIDKGKSKEFVNGLLNAGYTAVYVDSAAYENRDVIDFYEIAMGIEPYVSLDGEMYLFVLEES